MDVLYADNRLQFDDNAVFNEQINPMLTNRMTTIKDRNRLLSFKCNAEMPQLNGHCFFINGFEKAWSEFLMDANCGANDTLC